MTNRERLLQDGSNCPYREPAPMSLYQSLFVVSCSNSPDMNVCQLSCRGEMVEKLNSTAKGRRWLDDEIVDEGGNE